VTDGIAEIADFGRLQLEGAPEGELLVGVRAGQLSVGGDGGDLVAEGTASLVEYLGNEIYVHVRLSSGRSIIVAADPKMNIRVGDSLSLSLDRTRAHYFDPNGDRLPLFDGA
jgi:multiple sugar transport system ATP-binding protein